LVDRKTRYLVTAGHCSARGTCGHLGPRLASCAVEHFVGVLARHPPSTHGVATLERGDVGLFPPGTDALSRHLGGNLDVNDLDVVAGGHEPGANIDSLALAAQHRVDDDVLTVLDRDRPIAGSR
jgi:hypothetical protein